MKRSVLTAISIVFLLSSCEKTDKKSDNISIEETINQAFLEQIEYSNLVDKKSQDEVRQALLNGGISEENIDDFLENVNYFNKIAGDAKLVKEGFVKSSEIKPEYDEAKIQENWEAKFPVFPGYNCRITSFGLMNDFMSIGKPQNAHSKNLFIDKDAISTSPKKIFDDSQRENFLCLFSSIPTELHKDISKHLEVVKKAFSERQVRFKFKGNSNKASMISVFIHSAITPEESNVFIGHIGVLTPTSDGKLMFIEKLAFQEPYQATKFNNRTELNDYLMNRYDNEKGQPTAKPFILENDELLEGYRPNPNNIEH
ncbi:MAG: DUF4300 family protein [Flavobacteriaceae bacterium]|nr:DUF4300 family protein [Flavobacteriaceae bacterium]